MRGRNIAMSTLKCNECGNEQYIARNTGRQREKGHQKKLWCPVCKKEVNHYEIRNMDWAGKTLADVYATTG